MAHAQVNDAALNLITFGLGRRALPGSASWARGRPVLTAGRLSVGGAYCRSRCGECTADTCLDEFWTQAG